MAASSACAHNARSSREHVRDMRAQAGRCPGPAGPHAPPAHRRLARGCAHCAAWTTRLRNPPTLRSSAPLSPPRASPRLRREGCLGS
eukprot:scaffold409_cov323-Prasinococcus_capsulatus_cf.AAC.4